VLDSSLIDALDDMLNKKIPPLMSMLPNESLQLNTEDVSGGVFDLMENNPFQSGATEGGYTFFLYQSWLLLAV